MNDEILHRLVMDRQFDELSADTSALLDDYLRIKPEAAALAGSITATIRTARAALKSEPESRQLPPLQPTTLAWVSTRRLMLPRWSQPLTTAAAIVLAFFLGGRLGPGLSTTPWTNAPELRVAHDVSIHSGAEFWSLSRLKEITDAGAPAKNKPVLWNSPVAWPQLGEKS